LGKSAVFGGKVLFLVEKCYIWGKSAIFLGKSAVFGGKVLFFGGKVLYLGEKCCFWWKSAIIWDLVQIMD